MQGQEEGGEKRSLQSSRHTIQLFNKWVDRFDEKWIKYTHEFLSVHSATDPQCTQNGKNKKTITSLVFQIKS